MGTQSKRAFEHMPASQKLSQQYYEGIARGPFREKETTAVFVALDDVKCSSVCFNNTSGAAIGVRRGASGVVITLPNGSGKVFDVVDNAQELQIVNMDENVAVTVQYECGGEQV